jgi:hypothetical protein
MAHGAGGARQQARQIAGTIGITGSASLVNVVNSSSPCSPSASGVPSSG